MDITTLGIGVDSSQVGQGSSALDELTRAALKAAEAMDKVGSKGGKGGDDAAKGIFKGTIAADAFKKGVEIAIESVKQLYSLMSQAGDFADLGDMTGAAAENIAKLQTAADVAGVSMESMAGYMNQMTRVLAATDEEGDKKSASTFKTFKRWTLPRKWRSSGKRWAGMVTVLLRLRFCKPSSAEVRAQ